MNITPEYKGVRHASPWCLIQITCNKGRSGDTKDAFYTRVAFLISKFSSIESKNIIVSLIEVDSSCWSFGS